MTTANGSNPIAVNINNNNIFHLTFTLISTLAVTFAVRAEKHRSVNFHVNKHIKYVFI
jgi:hypothetical protein